MRDYSIQIRQATSHGRLCWALYIDGDFEGYFSRRQWAYDHAARICGYPAGMAD